MSAAATMALKPRAEARDLDGFFGISGQAIGTTKQQHVAAHGLQRAGSARGLSRERFASVPAKQANLLLQTAPMAMQLAPQQHPAVEAPSEHDDSKPELDKGTAEGGIPMGACAKNITDGLDLGRSSSRASSGRASSYTSSSSGKGSQSTGQGPAVGPCIHATAKHVNEPVSPAALTKGPAHQLQGPLAQLSIAHPAVSTSANLSTPAGKTMRGFSISPQRLLRTQRWVEHICCPASGYLCAGDHLVETTNAIVGPA